MFGSELTETNNEPTFRVFNIQNLTPKKFLIFAGLSLFQGGGGAYVPPLPLATPLRVLGPYFIGVACYTHLHFGVH